MLTIGGVLIALGILTFWRSVVPARRLERMPFAGLAVLAVLLVLGGFFLVLLDQVSQSAD
jgi:uncharacterized membrane protein